MPIELKFNKLSIYRRPASPVTVATPHAKGTVAPRNAADFRVTAGAVVYPSQSFATAFWEDGSVKWLLTRLQADLPGSAIGGGAIPPLYTTAVLETGEPALPEKPAYCNVRDEKSANIGNGVLYINLGKPGEGLFDSIAFPGDPQEENCYLTAKELPGFLLKADGDTYTALVGEDGWEIIENGCVYAAVRTSGKHIAANGSRVLDFELTLSVWAGSPQLEIEYRLLNLEHSEGEAAHLTKSDPPDGLRPVPYLEIEELRFDVRPRPDGNEPMVAMGYSCGTDTKWHDGNGWCNFWWDTPKLSEVNFLANEAFVSARGWEGARDVFGGVWFGDWRNGRYGVSVYPWRGLHNYPKRMALHADGFTYWIYPPDEPAWKFYQGSAKRHKFALRFHATDEELSQADIGAHDYELLDFAVVPTEVFCKAGVWTEYLPKQVSDDLNAEIKRMSYDTESMFGMMNYGDAYYMDAVFANNEYDPVNWLAVQYARTGDRAMLERHWMYGEHALDVDICHFSHNPLRDGAEVEHCSTHIRGDCEPCHQWVEGLLTFWHTTGDRRALIAAERVGEATMRLAERWVLHNPRFGHVRQLGWPLRCLAALYGETHDTKWAAYCDKIVNRLEEWEQTFGVWMSMYSSIGQIRVPFMMSVAIRGLVLYNEYNPQEKHKEMILRETADLFANCRDENGDFYYKEMPFMRVACYIGHIFECAAAAYRLSGDKNYLEDVLPAFRHYCSIHLPTIHGPRNFGEVFPGVTSFPKVCEEAGIALGL
ncbi:MAG: hypothetical protein LBR73_08720 [Oscillospiraceae bacterium]|nr:hypothetical protein [Oscillospiraceae bacterium]